MHEVDQVLFGQGQEIPKFSLEKPAQPKSKKDSQTQLLYPQNWNTLNRLLPMLMPRIPTDIKKMKPNYKGVK